MKKILAFAAFVAVMLTAVSAMAAPIVMDGSTTVLPFGQAAAEQYMKLHREVKFSVSGTGTGNGFKSLADGSAKIANASRFIKESELETCIKKKVYPVPFAVAYDCIVPVVHPSNIVKNLTREQLKGIFSGKITNWKAVGGPNSPIVVVGRDTSSGTYGTWQDMIMDKGGKTRVTPRAQVTASSGALMTAIAQNRNAIGYDGMGYVNKSVKAINVDGIKASAANARSGKYPLARYLYMFTNGWPEGHILDFIKFMQGEVGQRIVSSTGFVSLRDIR